MLVYGRTRILVVLRVFMCLVRLLSQYLEQKTKYYQPSHIFQPLSIANKNGFNIFINKLPLFFSSLNQSGLFFKSNQKKLGWRHFQLFSWIFHPPNPWSFMIPNLTCAHFPKMDWFNHQLTFVVWKVESYVAWIYHPATAPVSTRMTWMPWTICRIGNPNRSTDSIGSITGKGINPRWWPRRPRPRFRGPGHKIPAKMQGFGRENSPESTT